MNEIKQNLEDGIECLSLKEVATILGVTLPTIQSLIKTNKLTAFQLTEKGSWRVRREHLTAYIEERESIQQQLIQKVAESTEGNNHATSRNNKKSFGSNRATRRKSKNAHRRHPEKKD